MARTKIHFEQHKTRRTTRRKGAVTLQRMIERMSSVCTFQKKLLIRTTFDSLNPSYRRRRFSPYVLRIQAYIK